MKRNFALLIFAGTVLLSSCTNYIYFTQTTRQQIESSKADMKRVQFYNSETIVLARQIKKEDVDVVSGKVKLEKGKYIEEIVIKKLTPGVMVEKNDKVIFMSFEDGDGKVLPFMRSKSTRSRDGDLYEIGALDWKKSSQSGRDIGVVNYDGNKYSIVHGSNSRLLISKSELNKVEKNSRVAKGRKID